MRNDAGLAARPQIRPAILHPRASIIFGALFIATMVEIGAHDSGFIYVFLAECLGAVFVGVAALFLLASVFFPRPID
ncbi:MAG TPA: hypothetical protein VGQ46_09770 [Thermoanaerobaculia bacterium]|jgi:hypothetical protein|nr:hypothetical protein [Thermoanaerobaculia bacterium]